MGEVTDATLAARCGSCGRFLGPYTTCPYCGARVGGRVSLKAVKIAAVVLAVVGLIGLWWAGRQLPIPLLTVEETQGTMNMAYVRVRGRISRSLTYDPNGGYLAFWVDDGTGEVRISSYRDVTAALLAAGKIPAPGDRVEVAGTLRIREDFVALTLNTAEHLQLERPEPVAVKIGTLTALDEGLRVRLEGEVQRVLVPYEGLTILTLQDDTGAISVAVDETLTTLTGALPEVVEGQTLVVTGTVTLYRDEPQLTPASVADIVLTAAPVVEETPPRPLNMLSADEAGAWVRASGRVVALTGFKGGVKATLDDGTGQVEVLLWQRVYDALPEPTTVDVGAELEVQGELSVYEGVLELEPAQPGDVSVRTAAPEIPWVEIASLAAQDAGRVVRLRGVTGIPETFSAGVKLALDDGTGVITVLLWSNVADALPRPPEAGMLVEVVGEVSVYRDELELLPRSLHDWRPEP